MADLLVVGDGPLTAILLAALRADGRRFARAESLHEPATRLRRATALILVEPPDPAAALVAVAGACRGRARRRPPLRLLVLSNGPLPPARAAALATAAADLDADAPLHLEPVDLERRAVRWLLRRFPPHFGADPLYGQRIHLVVAGRAPPVPALLPQLLRVAHYGETPALLTLLDDEPAARRAALERDWPEADAIAETRCLAPDAGELTDAPPVTGVFVCIDPPAAGLALARDLAARIAIRQRVAPPIVLEVGTAEPAGSCADWDGQLFPVAWRRAVLAPRWLLDGADDALAQVTHEHYRDTTAAQGRDPAAEAAGQPWAQLPESYRDANRHQADHLWAKLALTDCRALPEEQVESFAFTPAEVERLAIIEHARWAADRRLAGWRWAPVRDNARKHHPQLIPYQDLPDAVKDLDRFAVRVAPALLARSGLGVLRMLIVGVAPVDAGSVLRGGDRPIAALLRRLRERFPDRALVVASTLADIPARVLARRALDAEGAALFWLGVEPPGALLARLPDPARLDALALLVRAERRIALPADADGAPTALAHWLATRAEVLVSFGTPECRDQAVGATDSGAGDAGIPDGSAPSGDASFGGAGQTDLPPVPVPAKWVRIEADGNLIWGFEY